MAWLRRPQKRDVRSMWRDILVTTFYHRARKNHWQHRHIESTAAAMVSGFPFDIGPHTVKETALDWIESQIGSWECGSFDQLEFDAGR